MLTKQAVSLISTFFWGIYGITVGSLVVYFGYNNDWSWISIVVAIIGNSSHLVAMHLSRSGLDITAQPQKVN